MKERPILFSGPMVLALMRDPSDPMCKVETRRVVKPSPGAQSEWLMPSVIDRVPHGEMVLGGWQMHHPHAGTVHAGVAVPYDSPLGWIRCPYGAPGEDRLWVRETWRAYVDGWESGAEYRAGGARENVTAFNVVGWVTDGKAYANLCFSGGDRHPRHSLKWRPSIHMPRWASRLTLAVESVRVERLHDIDDAGARREGVADREAYRALWESINGAESWDANPWVWVVGFRRVTP